MLSILYYGLDFTNPLFSRAFVAIRPPARRAHASESGEPHGYKACEGKCTEASR